MALDSTIGADLPEVRARELRPNRSNLLLNRAPSERELQPSLLSLLSFTSVGLGDFAAPSSKLS